MSWHLGRMCGFDLETTSPDPLTARIVTACIVQVGGGMSVSPANWLADPGVEIPEGAAAIHGITTEHARAKGSPAAEVVAQLIESLEGTVKGTGTPIVAMNARYDLTVLDREAERYDIEPLTNRVPDLKVVDPFVIDKQVDKYRKGSRKLTALCEHYQVPIGDAHTADADAIAACRVAWRQGSIHPPLAAMGLEQLHRAQAEWAAEQAASLQEYFRRKDPQAVVEGAWPLIPRQRGGA
ncbi:3'-5' exonuclease [Streptomyces sp. NPDC058220]|uniref:3'-5' exonuclease n=1 Tax=Streptomyces sp. NPDC058220 TaxID=3346387 RepID=UPI0036F062AF